MTTQINNVVYYAPLEVKYWRNPAELAIICEVKNGTTYTTEVYTDGSKYGDSVGAAGIIIESSKLVHQQKLKLHVHCSNNKTEQIVILGVLEKLELQDGRNNDKHVSCPFFVAWVPPMYQSTSEAYFLTVSQKDTFLRREVVSTSSKPKAVG
jgi:hypothetical protein